MITKPESAVPHEAFVEITPKTGGHPLTDYRKFFTAAETAEIARAYGSVVHMTRKVHGVILYLKDGSKAKRRYYRLFLRCVKARGAWEQKFKEWEKGQ